MKINLICLVAAAAGQTTTWETTTTEYTTKVDDWCGRHHDTLESFTRQVTAGIDSALSFEAKVSGKFNEKRQERMKNQVLGIWNSMTRRLEWQLDGSHKKCLYNKVSDVPSDLLYKDVLGDDCALDLANDGLKNMCKQLEEFLLFAYSDCPEPTKKADRLQKRCRKMRKVLKQKSN